MKTKFYTTILLLVIGFSLNAQNVAISNDNSTPDPSAMLEVKSSDKGMLIPRMTLLERTSISNPAEGLTVYQTDDVKGFYYYDGSQWTAFVNTSQITSFGSGQIITTDERALVNSAVQTETDPILTANITSYGSGQVITNSERTTLNSALQSETDPVFDAHVASDITNAGSGSVITSAERTKLTGLQNNPAGTILVFAGETLPEGYLWCDGTPYLRNEYTELFTAIGENWGAGDGSNTFNVPDLRGYFLRGMDRDNGSGLANNDPDIANRTDINGTTVGNIVGSYQNNSTKLPNSAYNISSDTHSHSGVIQYTTTGVQVQSGPDYAVHGHYGYKNTDNDSHTHTVSGGDSETRPKNAYVNYIIKY